MSKEISRLEVMPVRDAFRHEAQDFTTWLENNIDALSDRLGLSLAVVQRENWVGDFKVDLLCEDGQGRPVIIENQLERTDHDHLGKVLTYVVNLDAVTGIWITSEPRNEHQKVMEWLNESTPADISFYLIKVEAIRIGESPTAPLFTVIVAPDVQSKQIGENKKEWAGRDYKRLEFWKALLKKCNEKTRLFSSVSAGRHYWLGVGAGRSGLSFNFLVRNDSVAVELYIDHDTEGAGNKTTFDTLHAKKNEIEREFGGSLSWERLDEKRACRVRKTSPEGGLSSDHAWDALHNWMIDNMMSLDRAFRGRIAEVH